MRPGPTATTSPSCGFSLAVSGITSPEAVVCSASTCWMTMRSSSGLMETGTAHPFVRVWKVRIGTSRATVPAESLVRPLALLQCECQRAAGYGGRVEREELDVLL